MFDARMKRKLSPEKEADTTRDDLKMHRIDNVVSQQICLYSDIVIMVYVWIILADSDTLIFSISNIVLFITC